MLKISNFQSISSVSLPIKGFTALIGKSNRGKSAILRALQAVLLNEWNVGYVKIGEKETTISFEIEEKSEYLKSLFPSWDVHSITLLKPTNEYTITLEDGKTLKYPKVGKGVPEKFAELNISEIETEREDSFNLNFQGQLDPLFLITSTEVEITSFINKVFDISRFEKALRDMKTDDIQISRLLSEQETAIKNLGIEEKEVASSLQKTEKQIFILGERISKVEKVVSYLQEVQQDLNNLVGHIQEQENLEKEKVYLEVKKVVYNNISRIEGNISELCMILSDIQNIHTKKEMLRYCTIQQDPFAIALSIYKGFIPYFSSLGEISLILLDAQEIEIAHPILSARKSFSSLLTKAENSLLYLQGMKKEEEVVLQERGALSLVAPRIEEHKTRMGVYDFLKRHILGSLEICPVCEQMICKDKMV